MIEKIYMAVGGRKFLGMILLCGGAIAVDLTTTRGLSTALAGFLGTVYAIYAGTNIIAKKDNKVKGVTTPPEAPSVKDELDLIADELTHIKGQLSQQEQLTAHTAESVVNTQKLISAAMGINKRQS